MHFNLLNTARTTACSYDFGLDLRLCGTRYRTSSSSQNQARAAPRRFHRSQPPPQRRRLLTRQLQRTLVNGRPLEPNTSPRCSTSSRPTTACSHRSRTCDGAPAELGWAALVCLTVESSVVVRGERPRSTERSLLVATATAHLAHATAAPS
ncbi:hypothetical protein FA09DRAFT_247653 [Tilletiopsis washingtonensis]|uniref:Uncharacterized protein n=1 Tax=Tilletiopsis washingtonensis TaxID=58919 RepID=A0A316ZCL6_9BASI|nr:hypothetical protein FA09DRAFT_247653 [Tilletiopsis washingtonensis]PWN98672.1 hypothetical protein FA09DRAFT_247653 [Tilletiopsis washingtonensis]